MHEGLDQHHLALVSGRVLAELAAGVELKALDQPLEVRVIDATPQVCEILEDLSARQIGIEGRLTGHIADETLDLQRLLPAIEPGDLRRAGVGVQQGHQQADGGRLPGTVWPKEAEDIALLDLERDLGDAALATVALAEFFDFDDGGHVYAGTVSDRRSVYSYSGVRQGAAEKYTVGPVGAGGAAWQ